ncbi:MAG: hypothetical protein WCK27_28765 [Verrucomicrobiota bacterium]
MSTPTALAQGRWNYCDIQRNDGFASGMAEAEQRLDVVEELGTTVAANLRRATRLRQSILQKAFTGQLV